MRFNVRTLLCLSALSVAAVAASASTIPTDTYYLDGATVTVGSIAYDLTGTVDIVNGVVTGADLTFQDAKFDDPGLPNFNHYNWGGNFDGLTQAGITNATLNTGQVILYITDTADANGNFDLCLHNGACGTSTGDSTFAIYGDSNIQGFGPVDINGGYLSLTPDTAPPAATPEPSSLALLGTGILGVAGITRRRWSAR